MARRVEIVEAANKWCDPTDSIQPSAILSFTMGAVWADKHPSWKPTDEQLNALHRVSNGWRYSRQLKKELVALYEQLKNI
jgi:hypothetical protein